MVGDIWFGCLVVVYKTFGYFKLFQLSHVNGGLSHQSPRKSEWRLLRAIP
jgi:hypothetical protein